jgi:integrase
MKRFKQRIYWRDRGGALRAYADFRDYADVGGCRAPLVPPGQRLATTDLEVAQVLVTRRLQELDAKRRGLILHGYARDPVTIQLYASEHLLKKSQSGRYNPRWLALCELHFRRACEFFGASRGIQEIGVADAQRWMRHLEGLKSNRGEGLTGATIRQHLNTLSNLYRRAQSENLVPLGYNPIAVMLDKPRAQPEEARWLEVHEASLLLEAARIIPRGNHYRGTAFAYPLLATFLLTGGRRAEVLGLEVEDVSFDRRTIRFRKNQSRRRLKSRTSQRSVPMWPQLEEILRPYVFSPDRPPTRLLFPRFQEGREAMLTDFRKMVNRISIPAGWEAGAITSKMFRHTYCSARLATLDHGAPVSPDTVRREMGHSSRDLVEQVYGHLGTIRHRAEVVEYRAHQHMEVLGERLESLYRRFRGRPGTTAGTAALSKG